MSNEEDNIKPNVNEPLLEKTETDGISSKPPKNGRNSEENSKFKRNKSVVLLLEAKKRKTAKWKLVPPDGGWGWLVLFGATLVNVLVPGLIKSFGVLFVEFLEAFKASTAEGMWIPALCYFLYSSLGPISSILSVKYSYRTVTVLGGIFAVAGMILSFWANSVYYLYFSYGVLFGCGAGLSFPPTVYIVCSYFVKLRGVANGICISGSAFGSILIPPLLRLLLVTYGYRGAVLIMGGITLNVFVAALFYDKVDLHMKRVKIEPEEEEDENDLLQPKIIINQEDSMPSLQHIPHNDSFLEHIESTEGNFNRSVSSATVQNLKSQYRERKISMPTGKNEVMKAKAGNGSKYNMSSNSTLHAVPEKQNGNNAMDMYSHGRLPNSRRRGVPRRSTSTSSFQYVSTPYHGSTLTLQPEIFASSFSLRSSTKTSDAKDGPKKTKLFDFGLLKDPLYLIILISNATNAISYTNFIILLPSYAQTLGFSKDQGALLLSIVSALDLIGRIGGSALSDITSFPKWYYFVGGLLFSGITLSLMPIFKDFWIIAAFCSVFGLASGTYVGITAIVMADMLGEERLQSTYGMGLFVNGILQLIGPPLCGIWYEMSNSYISLFISLGLIVIVGSMLWGFIPLIQRKSKSNNVEETSP